MKDRIEPMHTSALLLASFEQSAFGGIRIENKVYKKKLIKLKTESEVIFIT